MFTSREQADLAESLRVATSNKPDALTPFQRDQLFLHIYESCKHRPKAIEDATAVTQTVIDALLTNVQGGCVTRADIVTTTLGVLKRFDVAAATVYAAYHPL